MKYMHANQWIYEIIFERRVVDKKTYTEAITEILQIKSRGEANIAPTPVHMYNMCKSAHQSFPKSCHIVWIVYFSLYQCYNIAELL